VTHALARPVRIAAALAALGVATAACGTSGQSGSTTTTQPSTTSAPSSTTTTTTTTAPPGTTTPPTTAAAIPPAPQPNAETAAQALVTYWAQGNRATALRVATTQAVATLFAVPYPSGLAINRGCTSAFPPIICTFGAPGGGPTNAPIYQVSVSQAPGGWYVSSVQIES